MAKKQTRRTISLNRGVYNAADWAASQAGVTTSRFVTDLIRRAVPNVPQTHHIERKEALKAVAGKDARSLTSSRLEQLAHEISRVRGVLGRLEAEISDKRDESRMTE